VMSKRHLTWIVNEGIVDGWNDPRLPTVRGVMRRGMTVEGLKQFIVAQGGSRAVVTMEWDKLWAFNKKVIDPVAPRFTALDDEDLVIVQISDAQIECKSVPLHPKDATVGEKMVWFSSRIRFEQADARSLNKGDMVTLINWGNVQVEQVDKDEKTGRVVQLIMKLRLDNKDYKKTPKLTWISTEMEHSPVSMITIDYDHIISKAVVSKDDDWKQYINYDSRHYRRLIGESALRSVRHGDIVQLQRKGFFICDRPYQPASPYSQQESPLILVAIPDGHVKETLTNKTTPLLPTPFIDT